MKVRYVTAHVNRGAGYNSVVICTSKEVLNDGLLLIRGRIDILMAGMLDETSIPLLRDDAYLSLRRRHRIGGRMDESGQ